MAPDQDASADKDFGKRDGETAQEYLKREFSALEPFVIISLSYLLFTTTDGAIRMIVLLHAYNSGFTAWEVALMFTLYELAGGCPMRTLAACQHVTSPVNMAAELRACVAVMKAPALAVLAAHRMAIVTSLRGLTIALEPQVRLPLRPLASARHAAPGSRGIMRTLMGIPSHHISAAQHPQDEMHRLQN